MSLANGDFFDATNDTATGAWTVSNAASVPEPSSFAFIAAVMGFFGCPRRKKREPFSHLNAA